MTEALENQIIDMISHLNAIYGKGRCVGWTMRKRVWYQAIQITKHIWSDRATTYKFTYKINKKKNKVTVRTLGRQITAPIGPQP